MLSLFVRGIIALVGQLINKPMRYQVIFQFPETFFATHNDLVAFEEKLIASISVSPIVR